MRIIHLPPLAKLLASFALMGTLSACQSLQSSDSFLGVITPYKVEVVQGNVITKEQAAFIRPGMSRAQVQDLLGSPLIRDPFHADRWDYVFTIRRQGAEPQRRHVALQFDGETLKNIEAPELPSEREFVASIDTFPAPRKPSVLALTPAQIQALPSPPKPTAADTEPVGAVRSYPPLEAR